MNIFFHFEIIYLHVYVWAYVESCAPCVEVTKAHKVPPEWELQAIVGHYSGDRKWIWVSSLNCWALSSPKDGHLHIWSLIDLWETTSGMEAQMSHPQQPLGSLAEQLGHSRSIFRICPDGTSGGCPHLPQSTSPTAEPGDLCIPVFVGHELQLWNMDWCHSFTITTFVLIRISCKRGCVWGFNPRLETIFYSSAHEQQVSFLWGHSH